MTKVPISRPCCAPNRPAQPKSDEKATRFAAGAGASAGGSYGGILVDIPGGKGLIGTSHPWLKDDGEGPLRKTRLAPFKMSATQITNADFADFVDATGYQSDAEKYGWSFVFHTQVPKAAKVDKYIPNAPWWGGVDGAYWRQISGPFGPQDCQPDHPAVHISFNDACAYCQWVGGRLPCEAEWEHAARGGLGDVRYPWGDQDPDDVAHFPCNIWQGDFPNHNSGKDGFLTTAPVRSFAPNGYGLYQMAGNCWDWTADDFRIRSLKRTIQAKAAAMKGYKTIKGGSFLCHKSYCTRYRIAARTGNSPSSSSSHTSFRVVFDV